MPTTREFVNRHYRHFNAASLRAAAEGYVDLMDRGGKMLVSMSGAMSTAELGISLAEMIRQDRVHAISCTGANLEEDIYNLVAHNSYEWIPNWRELSAEDDEEFLRRHLCRVTDTAIPEEEAMKVIERELLPKWKAASESGEPKFPHEFFYDILLEGKFKDDYDIDPKDSWLLAAAEKNLPIYVPGWEDSTCGNMFAAYAYSKEVSVGAVKGGIEYMMHLATWYRETTNESPLGFFQIGGGIPGDFAICVTPLWKWDLNVEDIPLWAYFCQISETATSYGSYSGAPPTEKITWSKLDSSTPRFMIESDATIVAPLIFSYVLDV